LKYKTPFDILKEFYEKEPALFYSNPCHKIMGLNSYLVMFYFLGQVGKDNTFLCTDYTEKGGHLMQKLEQNGMIQRLDDTGIIGYPYRFKVIKDATEGLRDYVNAGMNPFCQAYVSEK
jgi:hypothetical protein